MKGPKRGLHWIQDGMKKRIYEFDEGGRRDGRLLGLRGTL